MATHRSLSISRPSKLQPKLPAQAPISRISAVASTTGSVDAQVNSSTNTLRCKQLDLDAVPTPIRVAPSVPATPSKKRVRRDTLDENGSSGHVERPYRVRQRLISTSSVVTIRPRKNIEDARPVKGTSAAPSYVSTDAITTSEVLPRPRPLSEINHSPRHTPHRTLRRVGTIEFPTMHATENDVSSQPSRIPIPIPVAFSRHSTPAVINVGASERARSSQCTSRHARESSSSFLDRFDLRITPTKVHTELWDLDDECVALYQFYRR